MNDKELEFSTFFHMVFYFFFIDKDYKAYSPYTHLNNEEKKMAFQNMTDEYLHLERHSLPRGLIRL